jgi:hypothetical protein
MSIYVHILFLYFLLQSSSELIVVDHFSNVQKDNWIQFMTEWKDWGMFLSLFFLIILGFFFYSMYIMPPRQFPDKRESAGDFNDILVLSTSLTNLSLPCSSNNISENVSGN